MSEPESFRRRRRRRSVGCGHIAAFLLTKGAMLKSTLRSKTAKRGAAWGTARRDKDRVARDEMDTLVRPYLFKGFLSTECWEMAQKQRSFLLKHIHEAFHGESAIKLHRNHSTNYPLYTL